MTVSQWQEISAVEEEELVVFFNESEIQSTTATRVIRDMIKDFKALTTTADGEGEEPEVVEEPEEVDTMDGVMSISFDGDTFYVTNPIIIEKILKLANSDK